MSRLWELECFDHSAPVAAVIGGQTEVVMEEERLQAFERGYRDGWDDAAKAHSEEQNRISSELATNLQALSFTYHEARNAILAELEGIMKGVVSRTFPETMASSLGEMIVERVNDAASAAADIAVEIVVSPVNSERVRARLEGMIGPPVTVLEESSLGEGQAFLRLGEAEQKIDIEAVLQGLSDAVDEFFAGSDQVELINV